HGGSVFHVRRQAGGSVGMVLAAVGRRAGGQTGPGKGDDRPRRGEPERAGSFLVGGAPCHSRSRPKDAGKPGAGGRRRRGNRLATFSANRPTPGSSGSFVALHGYFHAFSPARAG